MSRAIPDRARPRERTSSQVTNRPWYFDAVFYQVYPQSFQDTNGDGIGDLPGITRRLDYLQYLGVDALWLSPIFVSPFCDAGYDVADYRKIAPRYGTMADFRKMVREAHRRKIRILLDAVYNHTSIQHPWFAESRKQGRNPYSKWYMWSEPGKPPASKGGWWLHNEDGRHDQYLTEFHVYQESLNYGHKSLPRKFGNSPRDPDVARLHREMQGVTSFWLDEGVDGFRCDVPGNIGHKPCGYDRRLLEVFWRSIRKVCDRYGVRPLIAEEWVHPLEAVNEWGFNMCFTMHAWDMKRLMAAGKPGAGPFKGDPRVFDRALAKQAGAVRPRDGAMVMFTCNHDSDRISESAGEHDPLTVIGILLVMTQNAVPKIYQGDEIGMISDKTAPWKEWSMGRAQVRTPIQWTAGRNAGFSRAAAEKLYLPVSKGYRTRNVEAQMGKPGSVLEETRKIIACWKAHPSLHPDGRKVTLHARKNDPVYAYARVNGGDRTIVAVNLSGKQAGAVLDCGKAANSRNILVRGLVSGHGTRFSPRVLGKSRGTALRVELPPYGWHILEIRGF